MLSRIKNSKAYQWVSSTAELVISKLNDLEEKLEASAQRENELSPIMLPTVFGSMSTGMYYTLNHSYTPPLNVFASLALSQAVSRYAIKSANYIINNLPAPETMYDAYNNTILGLAGVVVPLIITFDPSLSTNEKFYFNTVLIGTATRIAFFPSELEKRFYLKDQREFAESFNKFKKRINDLAPEAPQNNSNWVIQSQTYSLVLQGMLINLQPIPRTPSSRLDITRLLVINNKRVSELKDDSVNEIAKMLLAPTKSQATEATQNTDSEEYELVSNSDDEFEKIEPMSPSYKF